MPKNRLGIAALTALLAAAGLVAAAGPAVAVPLAAPAAPPAIAPALPPGGSFVPVAPRRVLDTRLTGGSTTSTSFTPAAALPGVDLTDVAAVLANVTVVDAKGSGFVVVGAGAGTSNGNFVAGAPSATLALVRLGAGTTIPVTVSTAANVVVDVQGYVTTRTAATTATYTPLAAAKRVADTRTSTGLTRFGAGRTQSLDVRTRAGLPADATAVIANLTIAAASRTTYVTGWSGVGPRPTISSVNATAGDIVANRALLPLDPSGRVALYNASGTTDLVVDVVGYVAPDAAGSYYTPVAASRLLDTRTTAATVVPTVDAAGGNAVLAPSVDDLAPTTAVWLTLVGDQPAGRGYLTARPADVDPTGTSDVNLVPGRAVANAGPVRVSGANGAVTVTSSSPARVVADLSGWFQRAPTAATPAGLWSSTRYPDYTDTPTRRDTLPTALPEYFASGLFLGAGSRTTTRAFAVATDGTVQQAGHSDAQPARVYPWTGPTRVGNLVAVTALASAGEATTAATYALTLGQVYGFQSNADGELGTTPSGFITYPLQPTRVPLPTGVVATAVHAAQGIGYAVGADGTVYSWGRAGNGQLGRTPTSTPWVPAAVDGLTAPTAIAGDGDVTFAVDADGATSMWGTPVGSAAVPAPAPYGNACATATSLHADYNGVWELCDDGTVVQLSRLGRVFAATQTLAVSGVTAIGAGAGYDNGIRALLDDGRVATVPTTGAARYEAGFAGVTAINGSPGVQVTLVGG